MQGPKPAYRPHKPSFHLASGVLVRVCDNCGASWKLGPTDSGSLQLGWRPIVELDAFGAMIDAVSIDILYCPVDGPAPQRTAATAVERPVRGSNLCYCKQCNGKSAHFPEAKNCYCNSCKGGRQHNS